MLKLLMIKAMLKRRESSRRIKTETKSQNTRMKSDLKKMRKKRTN
jgi:hypothetical protein